jgi:hypothetical protein
LGVDINGASCAFAFFSTGVVRTVGLTDSRSGLLSANRCEHEADERQPA